MCEVWVRFINFILEEDFWLDDYFVVCFDFGIFRVECEVYFIYVFNGLFYLLAAGLDCGLMLDNLERFRQDILSAAAKTSCRYGYVYISVGNEN